MEEVEVLDEFEFDEDDFPECKEDNEFDEQYDMDEENEEID